MIINIKCYDHLGSRRVIHQFNFQHPLLRKYIFALHWFLNKSLKSQLILRILSLLELPKFLFPQTYLISLDIHCPLCSTQKSRIHVISKTKRITITFARTHKYRVIFDKFHMLKKYTKSLQNIKNPIYLYIYVQPHKLFIF